MRSRSGGTVQNRSLIMLLGAGLLLGCEQGDVGQETNSEPGALTTAEEAGRDASPGTADLFVQEVPQNAQLLYVGEEGSRPEAERVGAVFVPMSTFSVERDGIPNEFPPAEEMARQLEEAGVRGERLVIVGEPIPAGRAWAALDYLGLGDRAALFDGVSSDVDATRSSGASDVQAEEDDTALETDVRDDMIVDADWVRERLDDPSVAILDARPPAEFSGDTPGEGIDRPGHIAGARNVFWQTLVESPEAPRLKDEAELRRMFEEAGVEPGDVVVAYCRTGGQASFLYTVARHLGYDARLYDGSYVDWSRTDHPIETGS